MYYYVNKKAQLTGEHEIHKSSCRRLPKIENRIALGHCATYAAAKSLARNHFSKVDACYYCLQEYHKM